MKYHPRADHCRHSPYAFHLHAPLLATKGRVTFKQVLLLLLPKKIDPLFQVSPVICTSFFCTGMRIRFRQRTGSFQFALFEFPLLSGSICLERLGGSPVKLTGCLCVTTRKRPSVHGIKNVKVNLKHQRHGWLALPLIHGAGK